MKLVAVLVAASFASSPAVAQKKNDPVELNDLSCELFSLMAKISMMMHQKAIPLSDARKKIGTLTDGMADVDVRYGDDIAIDAYDSARYSTKELQESAVADYTDQRHVECLKMARASR